MQIHTVKSGDTIFKIAREYGTPPMKIIENNELENPDRLAVGKELLILNPTRTYNVRGSDTLRRIADRFGVKYSSLLTMNPSLGGTDKIYPGQILTIKQDTPIFGMAALNGYYYKHTKRDRLDYVMPYLTYLTVSVGKRAGDEITLLFDDTEILSAAKEKKKKPLMRVYDTYEDFTEKYADSLVLLAKTHGYDGIVLAAYNAIKSSPQKYSEFLLGLKRKLMECDLLLFAELDGDRSDIISDAADGYIIMHNSVCPEEYSRLFSEEMESSKGYMEIPSSAYAGEDEITKTEAEGLAYKNGCEIQKNSETGRCHFEINKYKFGKKETYSIEYESLENIKARLTLAGELGFMGFHFDIMNIPTEYLMMIESMFTRAELLTGGYTL
jgi:LysM repeat protein